MSDFYNESPDQSPLMNKMVRDLREKRADLKEGRVLKYAWKVMIHHPSSPGVFGSSRIRYILVAVDARDVIEQSEKRYPRSEVVRLKRLGPVQNLE